MKDKCPKCGSLKIEVLRPIKIGTFVSYYLIICNDCKHEFEVQKVD